MAENAPQRILNIGCNCAELQMRRLPRLAGNITAAKSVIYPKTLQCGKSRLYGGISACMSALKCVESIPASVPDRLLGFPHWRRLSRGRGGGSPGERFGRGIWLRRFRDYRDGSWPRRIRVHPVPSRGNDSHAVLVYYYNRPLDESSRAAHRPEVRLHYCACDDNPLRRNGLFLHI